MSYMAQLLPHTKLHHAPSHCRRITDDQKADLISEAAYYLAERRGFAPGASMDDWLAAERQIAGKFDGEYYCD
ncbi:DUF2934 domain-containing protein [Hydrocarboniphaga sp.]|uniref:DUF2934 domain-containing protein n=1 Tax=Hydrocarboniphaga sp. TaxID=2033016 RepID=UPI003D0E0E38